MKIDLKKIIILVLIVLSCTMFFACENVPSPKPTTYSITYNATEGGTIIGDTNQTIYEGKSGTEVTAIANEGYLFIKWSDETTAATRNETNVQSNITLSAIFKKVENNVTINYIADIGGKIIGDFTQTILSGGNATSVTAVPNIGYSFVKWSDGITTNTRTDENVVEDVTVRAIFKRLSYYVNYVASKGGTISGLANQNVYYGDDSIEVVAVPEEGYKFLKWSDGITQSTRKDSNITSAISVTANFITIEVQVHYTAGNGGKILGQTSQTINYGESSSEVTAVADEGYVFIDWSDGITTAKRVDINIKKEINATARFEKLTYEVKYNASLGGTIIGEKLQTVKHGEDATSVSASPDIGYVFTGWSDEIKTPTRTDVLIDSEINVTAIFEKITLKITYTAGIGGNITGEVNQTVKYGDNSTMVNAVPDEGYMFVKWSDGIKSAQRYESNVTKNLSLNAVFTIAFDEGNGTEISPYLISSYSQFLSTKHFPNSAFKLTEDLDLNGIKHIPLFDNTNQFHGYLNGGGYTIKNLTVDTNSDFPSLLGFISQYGLVNNLNMTGVNIIVPKFNASSGTLAVGAVCGVSLGRLDNIHVSGNIHGTGLQYKGIAIGGLVGQSTGTVLNCHSDITMNFTDILSGGGMFAMNIGGLIGVAENNVIDCSVLGKIEVKFANENDGRSIGGLIGSYAYNAAVTQIIVQNCNTNVELISFGGYCGGLIGYGSVNTTFTIKNCSTKGDMDIDAADTGGLLGKMLLGANSVIEDCYTTGNISNQGSVGGFVGILGISGTVDAKINVKNCYVSGNVEGLGNTVGGFAARATNINFYQSYTLGNVNSNAHAAGFVHTFSNGIAEECFTAGNITSVKMAAGFAITFAGDIKNCYSKSNIHLDNTIEKVTVGGLIGTIKGNMENCYYIGKIQGFVKDDSYIGALIGVMNTTYQIKNSHWLIHSDSLAKSAVNRPIDFIADTYSYENISNMSLLADTLNTTETEVWINRVGESPEFKFMINQ